MRHLPIIFALLFCTLGCRAQDLFSKPLTQRTYLLNGKATVLVPEGAIGEGNGLNELQTKIFLDAAKHFILYASLSTSSARGDLSALLPSEPTSRGCRLFFDRDSMQAVLCNGRPVDSVPKNRNDIQVLQLTVRLPDRSVFRLSAYIDRTELAHVDAYRRLAERIFETVTAGPRRERLDAHTEVLSVAGKTGNMRIPLPPDYRAMKERTVGFDQVSIDYLNDVSADTVSALATIFLSPKPFPFLYEEGAGVDTSALQRVPGVLFGRKIDWISVTYPVRPAYLIEQRVTADWVRKGLLIQISIIASNPKALAEMIKVVEGMEVK